MKKSFLVAAVIILLSYEIFPQQVIGRLVDEDQIGLPGITLNLNISPNVYNTTTSANGSFSFTITEVKDEQLPTGYAISNNFPNPFNPKTRIGITLPNSGEVIIEVFNLLGQMVADAIEKSLEAGTNFMDVELNGLPNGMYFLRIKIDNKYNVVKKVMLIYGSQHLAVTDVVSNSLPNKNSVTNFSVQNAIIDSLVAAGTIIGRKTFTNLPNITGNLLDLGSLVVERYCPETPTVLYAGKLYKTVKIGSQCWLKENLNVGTRINGTANQTDNDTIEKYCYNDSDANCSQYGGLYQWNEVIQYATTTEPKGICPDGWHVPTFSELRALQIAVGVSGVALLAQGQGGGINSSGFSALLAGYHGSSGNFTSLGNYANFWSSTEIYITFAYTMNLNINSSSVNLSATNKVNGFSVRCLKD